MEYIVYKRFRGRGISGEFNLRYGTVCREDGGVIYAPDGRAVCVTISENGWGHFRPNTPEGERRQKMLDKLYGYYESGKGDPADFAEENWPGAENLYWKNLLRTMPTDKLTEFYRERCGGKS